MAYQLAVNVNWAGNSSREAVLDAIRAADEGGVHSAWVAEAWGTDAVPFLTQIVERTQQIQVGSGILNIFSRTPGLLAQTFGTLDVLSGGRMLIGLGTSGAAVIEGFHGLPFKLPLTRMKEYVEIINLLLAGKPLVYEGKIFKVPRGLPLRLELPRPHIPIYIASLTPASVQQTGQIADGWLPIWTPLDSMPALIKEVRAVAQQAGRDPDGLTVRSPGAVTLTSSDAVERERQRLAGEFAFYVARMGVFYYEHIARLGHAEVAAAIKTAFNAGGSKGGTAAVPPELQQQLSFVTDSVEAARERLAEQAAAGIGLHQVDVRAGSAAEAQQLYERLAA